MLKQFAVGLILLTAVPLPAEAMKVQFYRSSGFSDSSSATTGNALDTVQFTVQIPEEPNGQAARNYTQSAIQEFENVVLNTRLFIH